MDTIKDPPLPIFKMVIVQKNIPEILRFLFCQKTAKKVNTSRGSLSNHFMNFFSQLHR